jgi:hypothetical protein
LTCYHEVDFGTEQFDLIIFGHIIHGERTDEGRKLERAHSAPHDQGLLIGEFVLTDERTSPEAPLLFGLNMINSPHGDLLTMREYREWLRTTGFGQVSKQEGSRRLSPHPAVEGLIKSQLVQAAPVAHRASQFARQ